MPDTNACAEQGLSAKIRHLLGGSQPETLSVSFLVIRRAGLEPEDLIERLREASQDLQPYKSMLAEIERQRDFALLFDFFALRTYRTAEYRSFLSVAAPATPVLQGWTTPTEFVESGQPHMTRDQLATSYHASLSVAEDMADSMIEHYK